MDFENIEEVTWAQVSDAVYAADPVIAKIIDEWNPGKDLTFFRIKYSFGDLILDDGLFQIPNTHGKLFPLNHSTVPDRLKKRLSYSTLPLGILLGHGVEVYRDIEDRVFSLGFFKHGCDIGIWEMFSPPAPYSLSAGARSIFMAPKITDTDNHKKLKHAYGLELPAPKGIFDQHHLFVELARCLDVKWESEILFFSDKWVQPKNTLSWYKFREFLHQKAWEHTDYARSRTVFEVSWEFFRRFLAQKGFRPHHYLIETLRHLVFISQGMLPAFKPASKDEVACPTRAIQEAYINTYGLKNYVPTIMYSDRFDVNGKFPVYYSLQNPTLLITNPQAGKLSSAIDDLRELKELMGYFVNEALKGNVEFKFENKILRELMSKISYDYFHSEMHTYGGIMPSSQLSKEDPRLMYMPTKVEDRQFANKGSFFRCCVKISPKS